MTDEELYERYKELEELKDEINSRMNDIEDDLSDKKKERLQKKYEDIKEISDENIDETLVELKKQNKKLKFYQKVINAMEAEVEIDPGRLMALNDGIFSIVMTLLIFGVVLPSTVINSDAGFQNFLFSMLHNIGLTIVSFILLASFWIDHHEFIQLKNLNIIYIWLNIFYLAGISFIPFTTTIIGTYPQFFLSHVSFGLNILLVIILFLIMLYYARKRGFLNEETVKKDEKYIYRTLYIFIVFAVVINVLDIAVDKNFIFLFLFIPIISAIRDASFKLKQV